MVDLTKCPVPDCNYSNKKPFLVMNHLRLKTSSNHGCFRGFPDLDEMREYLEEYKKTIKKPKETEIRSNIDSTRSTSETDHDYITDNSDSSHSRIDNNINSSSDLNHVQVIDPPIKREPAVDKCPGCGSTKIDWITIDQAEAHGLRVSEEAQEIYDYVCTKCLELIRGKKK